jgi:hypothetical protein
MTQTEINKAIKKADTALCKLQDLFSGYNITDTIATKVDKSCNAVRELISALESTQPRRRK